MGLEAKLQAVASLTGGTDPWVALTPAGVLYAFSALEPNAQQAALQSVLSHQALPRVRDWLARAEVHADLLQQGLASGWLHLLTRNLIAPEVKLDVFVPHVIASLSGHRMAALASMGGFCVGHTGFDAQQAEALCAAAADFSEFAVRQRARGWQGASHCASFHEDVNMLMPSTSFIPFWVDGVDYCLVLGGEPLINNPVFVELVWGIKASGERFSPSQLDSRH